ncbi:efflux RND transporter periplasmic adaptor subunit [Parasulfuritortus cantonensis]|uniref:Efflux RND transporter periplasmic adaptor subunit n=1 Tax=Parasulfuritortus cantonensis TaxID=2528202 RepID=A0A4R1B746_9PROT|nr:efflux RND transporter periplasmic adaptor subunit [Parasulfuritortus cantonensis]TCJ11965.1 efflux RND transporter periplasmic adaptor subunit [Parasulfuritortus cantonensis]
MRLVLKLVVVAAVLAVGFYLYQRPGGDANAGAKKDAGPVPILAAHAERADLPVVVDLVGRGEAYESVSVKARVDGQVQSVPFREGQHVHTGELLVRLDPADFDARLRQAEADLARDQAQLQKARADVVRYQALRDQGFVSAEKLTDLNAALAAAEATVQADRAAADLARLQRAYATVRAPIDGVVGARLVFPGTAVKNNDTVLAVINRMQPLLVSFALPERHVAALRAAMARGPVGAAVATPDQAGPAHTATVHFLDNAVDPGTGTLLVKARLDNRDAAFAPGQYLRVELVLDTLKNAVTVPAEAVQQGPKGSVVYVVRGDDGIDIRPVKAVAERAGRVALAGVQAGETVVTDGHLRLTPKSKVKIKEAAPGTGAGR